MIKLIATDMDGTLLNEKEELNPEFFEIFKKLKEKDILFAVASGRQKDILKEQFDSVKDEMVFIFENGSCATYKENVIYKSEISKILVSEVIDLARERNFDLLLCTEDVAYIEGHNTELMNTAKNFYKNVEFIDDLKKVTAPVVKLSICDFAGAMNNSYKIFNEKFGDRLKLSVSMGFWLHMISPGVNKGFGVKSIQEKFGISPDETMVFGDNYNDIEMLQSAKYSFAMDNALDDVKAYANFIAPHHAKNGVLETIKRYVVNGEEL